MPSISISSNIARVPNRLASQIMYAGIAQTNASLLELQTQMATGKVINRPSDDAVFAGTVSVLDDILERRQQRLRNFTHAEALLNNIDSALADAGGIMIEARSIGLSQIGATSDAATRENQAQIIDGMLNSLIGIGNRQFQQISLFGGSDTRSTPFEGLLDGLRYAGQGDGLTTDLGFSRSLPITMAGPDAFGSMSTRVEGDTDLDPVMVGDTRLADLHGALGTGVRSGSINIDFDGTQITVDLSDAHTVQDVVDTIQTELDASDGTATIAIDATGTAFEITGLTSTTITISDPSGDGVAADLGLDAAFTGPAGGSGADINPKLTERTLIASLGVVPPALGEIRLTNAGQSRDLDLSGATTVQDIQNIVTGANLGVRVVVNEAGDRLDFVNELSGGDMAIAEVSGGTTATQLGVRTLTTSTLLSDFNRGQGVNIVSGSVDPTTGLPDPTRDLDFKITLKDAQEFDVDLAGSTTVQDVLDAINAAAAAAGVAVPGEFEATMADDGNGIQFTDSTLPVGNDTSVTRLNGSSAAEDLGILGTETSATFVGEDRAKVAVESVFTHLMDLRDALRGDDSSGISLATDRLQDDIDRAAQSRGVVGVRTRRVTDAVTREEDLKLQDLELKSQVQDLDFTEASLRFAALQQQLQAGLTTAARLSQISLLDFLG